MVAKEILDFWGFTSASRDPPSETWNGLAKDLDSHLSSVLPFSWRAWNANWQIIVVKFQNSEGHFDTSLWLWWPTLPFISAFESFIKFSIVNLLTLLHECEKLDISNDLLKTKFWNLLTFLNVMTFLFYCFQVQSLESCIWHYNSFWNHWLGCCKEWMYVA